MITPRKPLRTGYTLLELLIVISIFSALFLGLSLGALVRTSHAASDAEESASGSIRAVFAIQRLISHVRESRIVPSGHPDELTLMEAGGTELRYFLQDGRLVCQKEFEGRTLSPVLLKGVTSFQVAPDPANPSLLSVSITIRNERRIGKPGSRTYDFRVLSRLGPSSD